MKPICSIIIRAYNEEKHIGRLLAGIRQQTIQPLQVILVDSGSTDATVAIALSEPVDVLHIQPGEFTFGRSLNLGISHAQADLVVIASAHVYPIYPDWLERLLAPFSDPLVALVYGMQRGSTSSHFSEQQIFKRWFPDQSQLDQKHPFCNNANSAIRKSLWDLHPYDENLPALEDLAWSQWAVDQGYKISYVAEAEIIHVHEESPRGILNRYKREGMAFKQIYPQATFGLGDLFSLWITNSISDCSVARQQKDLCKQFRNIVRFRWLQFLGTYRGYHQSGQMTNTLREAFYYPPDLRVAENRLDREVAPIQYHDKMKPPTLYQ